MSIMTTEWGSDASQFVMYKKFKHNKWPGIKIK